MLNLLKSRLDWRVLTGALAFATTIALLLWTNSDWNRTHMDSEMAGVTTGISPANTVYPRLQR